MSEPILRLKQGREASLLRRHPWIFGGAVEKLIGNALRGGTVVVRAADGKFLCRAAYNADSQIVGRVWSWNEDEAIDATFFERRLDAAISRRRELDTPEGGARWVNAENDGLPGLIVDRYAGFAVAQFLSAGAERWKKEIVAALSSRPGIRGVHERSDADVRAKEGLLPATGTLAGEPIPPLIEIIEYLGGRNWGQAAASLQPVPNFAHFFVDAAQGHKTGFYLDQRPARALVREIAKGAEVLNAFCYTGGLTVAAQAGGATKVESVDSSGPALDLARKNLERNSLSTEGIIEADVFEHLRRCRDAARKFDLIILDPPKFVHSKNQIEKGTRAYKDINMLAMKLLRSGGKLLTFSCSGLVSEDLFQKVLFGAALDAGRDARILRRLGPSEDHPVSLYFPEGAYLKGFLLEVE